PKTDLADSERAVVASQTGARLDPHPRQVSAPPAGDARRHLMLAPADGRHGSRAHPDASGTPETAQADRKALVTSSGPLPPEPAVAGRPSGTRSQKARKHGRPGSAASAETLWKNRKRMSVSDIRHSA